LVIVDAGGKGSVVGVVDVGGAVSGYCLAYLLASFRGRLHVYESVYESPNDSMHDLLPKGFGF
jgi:hypothetical protein